jgi:hypothetical protein
MPSARAPWSRSRCRRANASPGSGTIDNVGGILLIVLIAGVLIAAIIYAQKKAQERRDALAAWARARGLTYSRDRQRGVDDAFAFQCLRQGDNRYAHNVMQGRWERYDVYAFDYHYETHSTDSKGRTQTHSHSFSAVIVTPPFPIKPLAIRREHLFDKVGEFFGLDDIDFELAEFSREFHVTAKDRRWAYDVLHQEAMEYLLASPRCTIEFVDGSAIVFDKTDFSATEFETALRLVTGLIGRIPADVIRHHTEGA